MLKAYLKQVCTLEKDIYEKNLKLNKALRELERVKKDIATKKEHLQKDLDQKNSELNELKRNRAVRETYRSAGLKVPIAFTLIIMAVTVGFTLLAHYIVTSLFGASDATSASMAYLAVYAIPAVLVIIFLCYMDLISTGKVVLTVIIYGAVDLLTWVYLDFCEEKGLSISASIILLMVFALILEGIIGAIACWITHSNQLNKMALNKREIQQLKAQEKALNNKIQSVKAAISSYNTSSNQAIANINQDIQRQQSVLAILRSDLRKLYAKNILHPNYQRWVAAATIYEYLDEKRCYKLEGYDGAYNIYNQELMAKKILDSLGELHKSVEKIGNYASMIYNSQQYIRHEISLCNRNLENYQLNTYGY